MYVVCYERHLTPSECRANMLSIENTLQCGSELPPASLVPSTESGTQGPWCSLQWGLQARQRLRSVWSVWSGGREEGGQARST